jgi:uncharacterized Zn-finger protein
MADHGTPYFHNDSGVVHINIGAKKFMCIGALPPFDHPHVYLDMGSDTQAICPYCSSLFIYEPSLKHGDANPQECVWHGENAAA